MISGCVDVLQSEELAFLELAGVLDVGRVGVEHLKINVKVDVAVVVDEILLVNVLVAQQVDEDVVGVLHVGHFELEEWRASIPRVEEQWSLWSVRVK